MRRPRLQPGSRYLVALMLALMPLAAQSQEAGETPWFHHVTAPLPLPPHIAQDLCRDLLSGLNRGVMPETVASRMPAGTGPRAVFLSATDGRATARVEYGVGIDAPQALRQAFAKVVAHGPSRNSRCLKLDIVQHATPMPNFAVRDTALPAPGLLGIAFGPQSGFAFTPDQIIGLQLVDPRRRLAIHRIGRLVLDRGDWEAAGRWLKISGFQGAQKVVLFETQSYATDGAAAVPLYRGHALYETITEADLLEAAVGAADRLAQACTPDGRLKVDTPEWVAGGAGVNEPLHYAEAIVAMLAVYRATGKKTYLDCAETLASTLAAAVRAYGGQRQAACLVQNQYRGLDPEGIEAPRPIVALDTNAAAICALLNLDAALPEPRFERQVSYLAGHLVAQMQPGGDFVIERTYPALRLTPGTDPAANALAAQALVRLYERFKNAAFLEAAGEAVDYLLETRVRDEQMDELPREASLMAALDAYYTFDRQDHVVLQVQRLALAAIADQVREPDWPDMFGSVRNLPSATEAAERTHLLALAARLLRDSGREDAAVELLGETWPSVVFQLQARVLSVSAMHLERPERAVGLFRDHLGAVGFDLRGQVTQILSLLTLRDELRRAELTTLPQVDALTKQLAAARAGMNRFPAVLPASLNAPGERRRPHSPDRQLHTVPHQGPEPIIRPVPKR